MNQVQEMELQAVIFDFDGVIVDTEPLHWRAFSEALRDDGLAFTWEEYADYYIGFDDRDAFREVFQQAGKPLTSARLVALIRRKADAFQHLISTEPPEPYPGVLDRLREISGQLPLGLCSGALRGDIEPVLERFELGSLFDAIVTAEDVQASKPNPACYRRVLERLNAGRPSAIPPAGCLAVEDTTAGIASAQGAGMRVLAVSNSHPPPALASADRVMDSLVSVSLDDLRIWFAGLK
ncbi:MAG TPA: HAD family phosphatase [Kiritimatiellia bacterium]|nr:HAD family phosphatase [Kiritimatiellia bacterium]